jgi:phosphoglycerate dehydrogenase-like enzyme
MTISSARDILICKDPTFDRWLDDVAGRLKDAGHRVVRGPSVIPPARVVLASLSDLLGPAEIVIGTNRNTFTREAMLAAPKLRGIVHPSIGTESIDLVAADELGIAVAHGPTPENFISMAESTVLLILAALYDLNGTERVLRANLPRPAQMRASMLAGKTVGLVGYGRIAQALALRLSTWGARIITSSRRFAAGHRDGAVEFVDMDTLLASSDILSLHLELGPQTRHFIDRERLHKMKRTAILVNTARGGLIDEEALTDALRDGVIGGAALDTFEVEPLAASSPLRDIEGVVLTPHMVGHTREVFEVMPDCMIENVNRLIEGKDPLYFRNPEVKAKWHERLLHL